MIDFERVRLFYIVAFCLFLFSCKQKEEDELIPSTPVPPTDTLNSSLLMINAHYGLGAVDFYIENSKINQVPVLVGSNSDYVKSGVGVRNIKVCSSGSNTGLNTIDFNFLSGESYSVYAIGDQFAVEQLIVEDDLTIPDVGYGRIRFIHLSPDAPSLNLCLDGGMTLDPAFYEITYKEYSDFVKIPEGVYDLELRNTNTLLPVLNLDAFNIESEKNYTLYIFGNISSQTISGRFMLNTQ